MTTTNTPTRMKPLTDTRRTLILNNLATLVEGYIAIRQAKLESGVDAAKVGGLPEVFSARNELIKTSLEYTLEAIAQRDNPVWGRILFTLDNAGVLPCLAVLAGKQAGKAQGISRLRHLITAYLEAREQDQAPTAVKWVVSLEPLTIDTDGLLKRSSELKTAARERWEHAQSQSKEIDNRLVSAATAPANSAMADALTAAKEAKK